MLARPEGAPCGLCCSPSTAGSELWLPLEHPVLASHASYPNHPPAALDSPCPPLTHTHIALRFLRFAWEPFNTIIAFWLALAFHLVYAYRTQDSWVPDPRLIIWTRNAEATKHAAG